MAPIHKNKKSAAFFFLIFVFLMVGHLHSDPHLCHVSLPTWVSEVWRAFLHTTQHFLGQPHVREHKVDCQRDKIRWHQMVLFSCTIAIWKAIWKLPSLYFDFVRFVLYNLQLPRTRLSIICSCRTSHVRGIQNIVFTHIPRLDSGSHTHIGKDVLDLWTHLTRFA